MADSDGGNNRSEPVNLWKRWDVDIDDLKVQGDTLLSFNDPQLHRFCDIWPLDRGAEGGSEEPPEISFLDGYTRTGLRFTPQIVVVVAIILGVSAEVSAKVDGVSTLLPPLSLPHYLAFSGLVIIWLIILWAVVDAEIMGVLELSKAGIVYGILAVLVLGTAFSIYKVFSVPDPTTLRPNIIYVSGYLLLLLIGGLLVYDGMLKTENLLSSMEEKLIIRESKKEQYTTFKDDVLGRNLDMTGSIPGLGFKFKTRNLLAVLLVLQFGVGWGISHGPQNLDFWMTLAVNVLLDLFIVIVAFQFLMLVASLNDLLNANQLDWLTGGEDILETVPFHPDGFGGFRDLGQFAMRVNILLIWAGLYLVYRLYVQGNRVTPEAMVPDAGASLSMVIWGISFVGPVVVYLFAAIAWFYFSFYQMHSKMAYDREKEYIRHKLNQQETQAENRRFESQERRVGEIEDGKDWVELRNSAPVWPINTRQLKSLVSGTIAPIIFSIPKFLF